MKKAITIRLCIVIAVSMIATAFLGYWLQMESAKEFMHTNAALRINQVKEILEKNDIEIRELKEELEEDFFIRAKAAAYIIQNHPEVIGDLDETRKIASLLQVDELHLFDEAGRLYAGSEPKYFNYTFASGEQMQFFLPMLEDKTLQLCQEVTPNTAEGKQMQYIAVWREDGEGIIQIGMEPTRLLAAMEKNELSHIFKMMTTEAGVTIFAVDLLSGSVVGTTDFALLGVSAGELGMDLSGSWHQQERKLEELMIAGTKNHCVMEAVGDIVVVVCNTYEKMYHSIPANMAIVICSLCFLACVVVFLILRMLDRIIIKGIYGIIEGTKKIAAGDLDYRVEIVQFPEFANLSSNLNHMVESLLETTRKLSLVFQNVDIPVAVYEYNQDMKRVLATNKIGDILQIPEEELEPVLADRNCFAEKIKERCSQPYDQDKEVYLLGGKREPKRYIKVKSYQDAGRTLGIVVDMTAEIIEKQQIERERDVDLLTALFTRRAFFKKMEELLRSPEELKTAVLLMTDLDNLKFINDTWGHEYGDKLLKAAAALLLNCEAPHKLAARLSGDEFVLVIYGVDSQEEAEAYLNHLHEQIQMTEIDMVDGDKVYVSMSGGYVFYPEYSGSCRELLKMADRTMYRMKKSTKGRFARYQPGEGEDQCQK